MKQDKRIEDFLVKKGIPYQRDFSLAQISYLRLGGTAPYFVTPGKSDDAVDLLRFLLENRLSYKIIGNASNCLFKEGTLNRVFICLKDLKSFTIDGQKGIVKAEAGIMLPVFVKKLSEEGYQGYEGLVGIPGTVGGALCMNAGAYGNEIADTLLTVTYLDNNGSLKTMTRDEAHYSFRYSRFLELQGSIILSAEFKLTRGIRESIDEKIKACQHNRRTYQESAYPNLGSLFKTKDIYSDIARQHTYYAYVLWFLRKASRLYGRRSNRALNYVTDKLFAITPAGQKPYSDKTLNCLINRGSLTFDEALRFIGSMNRILNNSVDLEIEVVE